MKEKIESVVNELSKVILGNEKKILLAVICLLARGHLLIEDLPGTGKSTLSKALAKCFGLNSKSVHFTSDLLPSELGQILGVDWVVMGTFETSKPMSDAAGIAMAALFGSMMSTNNAVCNLDFYDTRDDELVVNYLKKISGSLGSDSQDLINILMRKVTRRIPYTK